MSELNQDLVAQMIADANKSEKQKTTESLLDKLAELGGKLTSDEDVTFQGTKLILPETMNLTEAIRFLAQVQDQEEEEVSYSRTYNYRPWDGAHATMEALKIAFGAVNQAATKSMFGKRPPELITINTGMDTTTQVPWGALEVAYLPGVTFHTGNTNNEYGQVFQLIASGPKKFRHHIEGVFQLVARHLATNSIYRGKAFDGQSMPQFLDISSVDARKVVYSEDTMTQLEANIWSLLRYTDVMEELGVPLKRAILLEGPFGAGKTLAAFLTAQVAVSRGWSFLMCRPGRDSFREVMNTARLYQPSVVFFEDVDVMADAGSDHISELLDIFDGIQAKGTKIICVLTTNYVEKIHKGMVRPGRLDSIIHVGALDHAGIRRLIEATVPEDLLGVQDDEWWEQVACSMEGYMPAFVREAVDRTVRYNVARNHGVASKLEGPDFIAAAEGLRAQWMLMQDAPEGREKDPVGVALANVVANQVRTVLDLTNIHYKDDNDVAYEVRVAEEERA